MSLSENVYRFKSESPFEQIGQELNEKTLSRRKLAMVTTTKDFIGTVSKNEFSIIDSFFPIGAACVINGEIRDDAVVTLRTTLNKPFKLLFYIWLILFSVAIIVIGFTLSLLEFLSFGVMLIVLALTFRLFIHGVYVVARNHALGKIKSALKLRPV